MLGLGCVARDPETAESDPERPTLVDARGPKAACGGRQEAGRQGEDSGRRESPAQEGVRTEDTMNVPVYNMQGAEVGQMPIDEGSLLASLVDQGINAALIKQAYVMYHANRRQGSARTRSRNAVSGSLAHLPDNAQMHRPQLLGRRSLATMLHPGRWAALDSADSPW